MVNITIKMDNGDSVSKNVHVEENDTPTCVEITEAFYTALLGFGYILPRSPEQIANILDSLEMEDK